MNPIRPLAALVAYLSERAANDGRKDDRSTFPPNGRAWRYGNGAYLPWPDEQRHDDGQSRRPRTGR